MNEFSAMCGVWAAIYTSRVRARHYDPNSGPTVLDRMCVRSCLCDCVRQRPVFARPTNLLCTDFTVYSRRAFFFHYYFHFVFPYFCVRLTHTTNNMHSTSMLRFTSCLNIHHIIFRVTDDAVCISTRQNATHHISFLLQFP